MLPFDLTKQKSVDFVFVSNHNQEKIVYNFVL